MTFKNEQPWYRSIASLFGLTMFCMVASKGFNQAAYSNLLFLLVWLGPNLLIAFWIKNIFLRLRNGVYAPVDSPYGNALYLVVGLSLTLIVVIGVNLYMFSWLRSETLLFFVGLHLISFLFFSITYVRSKELKLSHVLWGAIHTWVLPSILIYGLLFTLKIWPVSVDSVLFGVWAFVSGYRSTMDYFYQNDAVTGPSSRRLYLQAGNSLRALKIYLPFLEIILLGLIFDWKRGRPPRIIEVEVPGENLEIQKGLIHIDKIKYQNANESFIAAKKGFMSGIYTDIEVQESKINLISTKNKYISTVLSYLLQDLNIKKYTNDIDVLDIQEINSILIW